MRLAAMIPAAGGTYVLGLHLAAGREIRVGRLGVFLFPMGWYAYAGSAQSGLRGRLGRHLDVHHALHWHLDYLLARSSLRRVWYVASPARLECRWARALLALPGASLPALRFGASDCRCPAHLVYCPEAPNPAAVARALAEA